MLTLLRRVAAPLRTPTPEELESWPVREDRPAKPLPVTRVSKEAARLDRIYPGWHNKINKRRLDMGSMKNCVLGQLYGSFATGCSAIHRDMLERQSFDGHAVKCYLKKGDTRKAWFTEIDFRRKNF